MNWRKVKKVCEFIEDKSIHAIFLIINELIGMSMMFESHQIWISILGVILIVVSFILSNIEYKFTKEQTASLLMPKSTDKAT